MKVFPTYIRISSHQQVSQSDCIVNFTALLLRSFMWNVEMEIYNKLAAFVLLAAVNSSLIQIVDLLPR